MIQSYSIKKLFTFPIYRFLNRFFGSIIVEFLELKKIDRMENFSTCTKNNSQIFK
jgi:hypothetical protein